MPPVSVLLVLAIGGLLVGTHAANTDLVENIDKAVGTVVVNGRKAADDAATFVTKQLDTVAKQWGLCASLLVSFIVHIELIHPHMSHSRSQKRSTTRRAAKTRTGTTMPGRI